MARNRVRAIIAVLGVAAVASSAVVSFPLFRESWFLWRLESDDSVVRRHAVRRLGEIRSTRAIEPLLDTLRESVRGKFESAPEYRARVGDRAEVIGALINLSPDAVVPAVLDRMRRASETAERLAEGPAGDLRPVYVEMGLILSSLEILGAIAPRGIAALRTLLPEPGLTHAVTNALAGAGESGQTALIAELQDNEDWEVRVMVALALASTEASKDAIAALTRVSAGDQDSNVRKAAASVLKELRRAR